MKINKLFGIGVLSICILVGVTAVVKLKKTETVPISVTYEHGRGYLLNIQNLTRHVILFDDPRVGSWASGIYLELFAGQEKVAAIHPSRPFIDPMIPAHLSLGPVVMEHGDVSHFDLANYCPDLTNTVVMDRGDRLLWYARVWDKTDAKWIQSFGQLGITNIR